MDIEKIKPTTTIQIVFGVAPFFSALLLVFLCIPDLFSKIETLKLIGLCISISLPLFLINFMISLWSDDHQGEMNNSDFAVGFSMAGLCTTLILSICCLLKFYEENLLSKGGYFSLRHFGGWIAGFEILLFLVALQSRLSEKKSTKEVSKSQ